jgi:hypothetical protein
MIDDDPKSSMGGGGLAMPSCIPLGLASSAGLGPLHGKTLLTCTSGKAARKPFAFFEQNQEGRPWDTH